MSADAMTPEQKDRSSELYLTAHNALRSLAEERLNLSPDTRHALNETRGSLEAMDFLRLQQPTQGGRP